MLLQSLNQKNLTHHSNVVADHKRKQPDHHSHTVAPPPLPPKHKAATAPRSEATLFRKQGESKNYGAHDDPDGSAREKVLEVLCLFKDIFKQLEQEKRRCRSAESYEGSSRIDFKTQAVIEKMGKQVNSYNRIGSVPGIKVGDEFQYKTELQIIGLHFKTRCGIDYMKIGSGGEVRVATSIVASEGYGYEDKFHEANVMVYTGQGGNVIRNDEKKKTENQKMERGNLALANSVRERNEVRVIRGEERWDKKGKRYVYYGLYLVDKYWVEKDVSGKISYKFQLSRIPGQPPLT